MPLLKTAVSRWSKICKLSTSTLPEIPECKHIPSAYHGPNYDRILQAQSLSVSPSLKPFYKKPLLLHEGRAQWLWNHEGKRFLDMFAGIATVSVGHSHPKVVAAATEQMSKLGYTPTIYMQPRVLEYVEKLTNKLPGDLKVVYLVNSGSEATELAFLMSRVYTGNHDIISLKNAYHGGTYAASTATAMSYFRHPIPRPPGHIHVMNPDVYLGPWGGSKCRDTPISQNSRKCNCKNECAASEKYFTEFLDTFKFSLPKDGNLAAFIAESIQGIGGVVQFPKNYLKKVVNHVQKTGGLYIADEVQTGFGRTGEHFWGFESQNVQPDIVTMAKGIGNGFPLGAVVTTPEIANALSKAAHFNTFGGNPLSCAVGSAVLDVIEEEELQQNSLEVGTHLLHRLSTLMLEFPNIIGDVRGKGLMIGVELVNDSETKESLDAEYVSDIFEDMKDMGVLVGKGGVNGNVLRLKPPMCVTKQDADFTVEVLKNALQRHQDKIILDKESVFMNYN